MSKYRIKVPGSANFIPKIMFFDEWQVWYYIKGVIGSRRIVGITIEKV